MDQLSDLLSRHDVVLEGPSADSCGSVPLGNGDLAANVWCEGDRLGIHLATGDAWDAHGRLPKVGRLELAWERPVFAHCRQTLRLEAATVAVTGDGVQLAVWIDADARVLVVEGEGPAPSVRLHPWRAEPRPLSPKESHGIDRWLEPVLAAADELLACDQAVAWWRGNRQSLWGPVLRNESLGGWADSHQDPLLHRAVGGIAWGEGFVRGADGLLRHPGGHWRLLVAVASGRWPVEADACTALTAARTAASAADHAARRSAHQAWWSSFWRRSWIRIGWKVAPMIAEWGGQVERGWLLQRYVTACAGRGPFPIKFNGSLFTMDLGRLLPPGRSPELCDADSRAWGGCYWFQNTRLPYWPMLTAGDHEMLLPLFRMYRDMLPFCEHRTKAWYGHGGAFFPETLYFFGAYRSYDYGTERTGKPAGEPDSRWVGRYWCGALELLTLGLDRWAFTGDDGWFADDLLPLARAILRFYAEHYPRRPDGTLHITPAQSLETYQTGVEDPLPEVAGLRRVLPQLLAAVHPAIAAEDRSAWQALLDATPALPTGSDHEGTHLLPAAVYPRDKVDNLENPELYAVFPFRLYAVGRPGLDAARRTWDRRLFQDGGFGWRQDPIQAAYLGLAEHAWWLVRRNYANQHGEDIQLQGKIRFPAFWGPNFDWVPDQDHGGVSNMALQAMLLQYDGRRILLLPAWPRRIDVAFRLHAPGGTTVEAEWKDGRLTRLVVDPPERAADVELAT
ncbi:MAG: DUF5703 domain-containing protein [Planctomycetes bacterium]|nr:DUF5703 domain-containing protein [Planctomycetota bacterium]